MSTNAPVDGNPFAGPAKDGPGYPSCPRASNHLLSRKVCPLPGLPAIPTTRRPPGGPGLAGLRPMGAEYANPERYESTQEWPAEQDWETRKRADRKAAAGRTVRTP